MDIWLINHYAVPPKYYPLARQTCFARYLMAMGHTVTIFCRQYRSQLQHESHYRRSSLAG